MRISRIYQSGLWHQGDTVVLNRLASHYVLHVLRLHLGDAVVLFNGNGGEFKASIQNISKCQVTVKIGTFKPTCLESSLFIHLAQAITKGEAMALSIQKAVELGVASITPVITTHCHLHLDKRRWQKKLTHWQAIVIHACQQCRRNRVPIVAKPIELTSWLKSVANSASLSLVLSPFARCNLSTLLKRHNDGVVWLLIGPEGGLTSEEVALAKHYHFRDVKLGPRVLRTETAAIAAISTLQALKGDF